MGGGRAAGVADGAAFAFAAACGDRLACGLADVGAAARPVAAADRIMADAAESTPTPAWVALLRWPGSAHVGREVGPLRMAAPATRP